jgi:arylsulfatase A-like enzyme
MRAVVHTFDLHRPFAALRAAASVALAWGATGAFSSVLGVTAEAVAAEASAAKPNILIIVADDLGYGDLGLQGGKEIPTPHIDSIAAGGVRFTNGYVTGAVCSPTRAGLVTGRYQQRFGHEFNPGQPQGANAADIGLPLTETTIADALRGAGYATANVGKWHLGHSEKFHPQARGFDEFYGFLGGAHPYIAGQGNGKGQAGRIFRGDKEVAAPEHLTQAFGQEAAEFIKRDKDQPIFLYLTFNAVHNPLQPDEEHLAKFSHIADPQRKAYAGLLSGLDDAVGEVLASLRASGQEENTLVFFISDNGGPQQANGSDNTPLRGDKGTVWEGGIRVPYLVRWKGKLPTGAVYEQPVISLDVAATAAAAAGAKLGGEGRPVDGVNLLPYVLRDNKQSPHESLYWRFGVQRAVRHGNFKLLQQDNAAPQLFDLVADVGEQHDLAKSRPEVVAELNATFTAWNNELAEPLWKTGKSSGKQQRRAERAKKRELSQRGRAIEIGVN